MSQYDSWPAGAPLDRVVALKVVGIAPLEHAERGRVVDNPTAGGVCKQQGARLMPWQPTERIEHAWDVVVGMDAKKFGFMLGGGHTGLWRAEFITVEGKSTKGIGGTAPLAICRAALAALGVK
jgi:hypothetical protein